ncbi:MAG: hypothetical protein PHD26_06515, partial [Methanosarcinaceae archaeon]|nr:hypothetical protein [Methanosarcinaceae archaeon]
GALAFYVGKGRNRGIGITVGICWKYLLGFCTLKFVGITYFGIVGIMYCMLGFFTNRLTKKRPFSY